MVSPQLGDEPLVTVVIPTVNRPSLARAVQSVQEQSYQRVELLVLGDGCHPGVDPDCLAKFESCDVIDFPQSKRPAPLRNEGIRRATGELIAFLDDDDSWRHDKLSRQVDELLRTQAVGVCSNAERADTEGGGSYFAEPPSLRYTKACLANPVILSSLLVKKSAIKGTRWFPEDPGFRGFEDHLFVLQLLCIGRVEFVDLPLVMYDESGSDRLSDTISGQTLENFALVNRMMGQYLRSERPPWWLGRSAYNRALWATMRVLALAPATVRQGLFGAYRRIW